MTNKSNVANLAALSMTMAMLGLTAEDAADHVDGFGYKMGENHGKRPAWRWIGGKCIKKWVHE